MTAPADRDVAGIARGLTKAQERELRAVCRTNGGGVHVSVRILDPYLVVPASPSMRKLFDKDLIQGKAGGWERVVHTRLGWAVYQHILNEGSRP